MLILLAGAMVLLREALRRSPLSSVMGVLAYLYLVLALRELDLRHTLAPEWLAHFLGRGRVLWLSILGALVLGNALFQRRRSLPALREENWRPPARLFAGLLVIYVLSYFAEHGSWWPHATQAFFEEVLELNLEIGLFLLACVFAVKARASEIAPANY